MTMFAGSIHEAARRASLSVSGAVLLALSVAAALGSFCCSLKLSQPPWTALRRGGESGPCAASEICTVCLGEVSSDGKVRKLPECGHCFHAECIGTWLGYRRTCPLCRTAVSSRGGGGGKLRARAGWLLRLLMASACKWMDRHFDTNLALVYCHDSETLLS